ncbi:MAG TPA: hypothetical protein VK968_20470, partial [Roseimicrobium sp.]|nr:hypothetical protein [Roseimicrobium sp.]
MTPASDSKGNHRGLVITALLVTAVIAVIYGFFRAATREVSVDEGYLMITIRSFLSGHALYDSVFTQYGPIYYCYQWILHGALGIPLTHDTTRLLCLIHWLATSCIMGWAGYHLTRSAVAAGVVASQTMVHLALLANEPGHPQELIVLLLAASLLLASRHPLSPRLLTGLAVLGTVLVFIKINVGLFYMIALGLTVYCHLGGRFTSARLGWALAFLCAIPPFLLTRRHLNLEWCLVYTLVVATSIATTFLVAHSVTVKDRLSLRVILRWILPMALTTAVILGVTLAFGTSLRGALDGMLLIPLKTPNIALLPLPVTWPAVANAVVALGAATMFLRRGAKMDLSRQALVLKGLYALFGGLLLVGNIKLQIAFLLPWSWLVLVPTSTVSTATPTHNFPRIWLCLLTVWQSLQAYPIAGSQVAVATFPLVLGY